MPSFQLSVEAIEALTSYLESLQGQKNRESQEWEFNVNFILNKVDPLNNLCLFK
jgi:hypothetical protein